MCEKKKPPASSPASASPPPPDLEGQDITINEDVDLHLDVASASDTTVDPAADDVDPDPSDNATNQVSFTYYNI